MTNNIPQIMIKQNEHFMNNTAAKNHLTEPVIKDIQ